MPWECIRRGRRERSAGKPIGLRGGAANLILGRAVGKIFGHDLVKPFVDNRRIDPGLHSYVELEKADAVERLQPGGNRHGQLFFAD